MPPIFNPLVFLLKVNAATEIHASLSVDRVKDEFVATKIQEALTKERLFSKSDETAALAYIKDQGGALN